MCKSPSTVTIVCLHLVPFLKHSAVVGPFVLNVYVMTLFQFAGRIYDYNTWSYTLHKRLLVSLRISRYTEIIPVSFSCLGTTVIGQKHWNTDTACWRSQDVHD